MGDGTTTVVILAGEFLRECKPFVEDGVHPQNIIKYFREAAQMAIRGWEPPCPSRAKTRRRSASC